MTDFWTWFGAVAAALAAWIALPTGLQELSALWREKQFRRATRAINFAKEFPEDKMLREHAHRSVVAALVTDKRMTHDQRILMLQQVDMDENIRCARALGAWLTFYSEAGVIKWQWRQTSLASSRARKWLKAGLSVKYAVFTSFAFAPVIGWQVLASVQQLSWPLLIVFMTWMIFGLAVAVLQSVRYGELEQAERLLAGART